MNKVIIDQGVAGSGATGAAGVVPVLPLAEFGSRTPAPAQTNGAAR